MSEKKSYMDKDNILVEGFFDNLKKAIKQYPALKKDKSFQNSLKYLNKDMVDLEDLMNKKIKQYGLKRKSIKLKKFKTSDFIK